MGCGWSRLGNTAPDPCLQKAGAPPVETDGASVVFTIRLGNSGLLLSIRERRSAENAAPPRLNVGRLNRGRVRLRPGARASRLAATGCSAAPASALSRR